jgi:GcrA cell cycle regulator
VHWTKEQDQYLREHRGKISSAQIGAHLGCTRNAVIGRANRIGLEALRSYNSFEEINHAKRVRRVAKERAVRPAAVKVVALPPPSRIDDAAIPAEQRKSTMELGRHDCRWPVGDPQEPGFFFCGAVQRDGSSYCADHHHVAYNRIRESFNARPKFSFVVTTSVLETSAEAA